jgi:hypothetical protein
VTTQIQLGDEMSQPWSENLAPSKAAKAVNGTRNAIAPFVLRRAILGTYLCSMQVTNCSGVRTSSFYSEQSVVRFRASVTHRPQPIVFIFPVRRLNTRNAVGHGRERILGLPFPHTPSHGHVPDGTPSQSVCAMSAFGVSLCRPVFLLSLHEKASGQQRRPPAYRGALWAVAGSWWQKAVSPRRRGGVAEKRMRRSA